MICNTPVKELKYLCDDYTSIKDILIIDDHPEFCAMNPNNHIKCEPFVGR